MSTCWFFWGDGMDDDQLVASLEEMSSAVDVARQLSHNLMVTVDQLRQMIESQCGRSEAGDQMSLPRGLPSDSADRTIRA